MEVRPPNRRSRCPPRLPRHPLCGSLCTCPRRARCSPRWHPNTPRCHCNGWRNRSALAGLFPSRSLGCRSQRRSGRGPSGTSDEVGLGQLSEAVALTYCLPEHHDPYVGEEALVARVGVGLYTYESSGSKSARCSKVTRTLEVPTSKNCVQLAAVRNTLQEIRVSEHTPLTP